MDYNSAFGVEFREVDGRLRDGKPTRVVRATRTYPTEQADLWDALTNGDRIPRWFLPVSGDLRPGGRYQLEGNAGGTIIRCDPPSALDVTWEFAGNVSWVIVRLLSEADGTLLTLEHEMPKDEEAEAHWAQYGPGATGVGWDGSFLGLGLHIGSGGDAVDREAYAVWAASDAGKRFMTGSAEAWASAHIAAGEDPLTARSMAERTAAFYTGT